MPRGCPDEPARVAGVNHARRHRQNGADREASGGDPALRKPETRAPDARHEAMTSEHISRRRWTALFALLLVFVCYLSLKPSPAAGGVPWFPDRLARWLDRHDHCRNFIGFGALAFAGFKAIARHDAVVAITCCLLVELLEFGQLWLPRRTCDWADIACGWVGILSAWLVTRVGNRRR